MEILQSVLAITMKRGLLFKVCLLRSENSIIPESDWSFDSTDALEKRLRSLLCACFPSTPVKPKSCAILSGIIKSSLLREKEIINYPACSLISYFDKKINIGCADDRKRINHRKMRFVPQHILYLSP